jgi:hypothetical protein
MVGAVGLRLMKFQVISWSIMDLQPLIVWRRVFFLIFVCGVLVSYFKSVIGEEVQYFILVVSLLDNNN